MTTTETKPRLNADWHRARPMPKRPTLEQRVAWHREHSEVCACREVPPSLVALVEALRARGPK